MKTISRTYPAACCLPAATAASALQTRALSGFEWLEINARRNLQGPYTAAAEPIRRLVPRAADTPGLIESHRISLLCIYPDIADCLTVSDDLAARLRFSREGNARSWTVRLAHVLTDFLLDLAEQTSVHLGLSFANSDQADPADREFFSVLTIRADPERLRIELKTTQPGTQAEDPYDPDRVLHASTRAMHLACSESAHDWSILGRRITREENHDRRYSKFTRNFSSHICC